MLERPVRARARARWSGPDGPDRHPPAASLLLASRRLAVEPEHIVVVSDSDRLVRTAVTHGFGLVVGLDGAGRRGRLLAAGAHLVVDDLTDLDIPVATAPGDSDWAGGCGGGSPWNLTYADLDPPRTAMYPLPRVHSDSRIPSRGGSRLA